MRETKYRIWDKTCKKMVAVRSIDFDYVDEEGYLEEGHVTANHRCDLLPFDEVKLMQYTGMKDKNGLEIYEGDIVETPSSKTKYLVDYAEGCFVGRIKYREYTTLYKALRVIGNIYENPELLEREGE